MIHCLIHLLISSRDLFNVQQKQCLLLSFQHSQKEQHIPKMLNGIKCLDYATVNPATHCISVKDNELVVAGCHMIVHAVIIK